MPFREMITLYDVATLIDISLADRSVNPLPWMMQQICLWGHLVWHRVLQMMS